ncbi:hypothetical protein, conserved [Leishmania tarentolae]|uniref:Uncharacterized protein n=1 Tax=Leishmania tarentolae TaxID=5689 RepID=A0A640K9I8_LEITA|nr:hypothetical protein, conserved [Leishmania tarentolae]
MGGICSRATTKRAHHDQGGATGKDANGNHASLPSSLPANAAPSGGFNGYVPAVDRSHGAGDIEAGDSARLLGGNALIFPPSCDAQRSGASSEFTRNINLLSAKAPLRDTEPGTSSFITATSPTASDVALRNNGGSCPRSGQVRSHYDTYFPPGHDAGMTLGADKYTGVGVSPCSEVDSVDFQSFASPSFSNMEHKPYHHAAHPNMARSHVNPMIFTDDDTSVAVTASSAFATPRELRKNTGSISSFPQNTSIISRGSMMSERPHGYSYYNSNTMCTEYPPMPSSASLPRSAAAASLTSGAPKRNQRQQLHQNPHLSSPGQSSRSTITNVRTNRQVSRMRSFGGASTPFTRQSSIVGSDCFQSCCSYTDPMSSAAGPLTPATPTDVVTERDVRLLSGSYPVDNADGATSMGQKLHACRSTNTLSTHPRSFSSPSTAATGAAHPLAATRTQGGPMLSSVRDTSLLPPCSPVPTPKAPQLYWKEQASFSGIEGVPASEDFFSVPPSARDFFFERSSAAASTPAGHMTLDRSYTDTAANTHHQSTAAKVTRSGSAARKSKREEKGNAGSPESRYARAFGDAAAPSSSKPFSASFNSDSSPLRTHAPPLTKGALPEDRQVRHTPASTGKRAASHSKSSSGDRRKERPLRNLNSPPQAGPEMTAAADVMAMPPQSSAASNTAPLVDGRGTEASFASPSTASKKSARKSGTVDGPAAAERGRLTQPYVEASLPPPSATEAAGGGGGGGGNTVALSASSSGSTSSFSTVASSYRRTALVEPSSRRPPERTSAPGGQRHSSLGAGGDSMKRRLKNVTCTFSESAAHGRMASRAPAATATRGAGAADGAEATSASSPVPLTTSPKPWVRRSKETVATAPRSDLHNTARVTAPTDATTATPGGAGRRLSKAHGRSTPKENGGRTCGVRAQGCTGSGSRTPSAAAATVARGSPDGAVRPAPGKGMRRRKSASSSAVPPSATGAPKPTATRTATAANRELSDGEKAESVLEYAICDDDTAESEEAGRGAMHTGGGSSDNPLQAAPVTVSPPQTPPQRNADRTGGVVKIGMKNGTLKQETVLQMCGHNAEDADETRVTGFRVSPDLSNATVITSSAESSSLRPCSVAQLVPSFGDSTARLQSCGREYQGIWVSEGINGDDAAKGDYDNSEEARSLSNAGLAAVARQGASCTGSDGLGPCSVSATSGEEVVLAATPSSATRSSTGSVIGKYMDASTLIKEDAVPTALTINNGGSKC